MAVKFVLPWISLVLTSISTEVEGGGNVQLYLAQYYNRHGHDSTWDHCDSFFGLFKTSKCDPYFKIKMSGRNGRGEGASWGTVTTQVYKETDAVHFGEKLGKSLRNPIVRHFAKWMGRFSMEVEVMDHDYMSSHDLVDTIKVSMSVNPDGASHLQVAKGKSHGMDSRLTFTLTVTCDPHYYGRSCTKRCVPRDDNGGHYSCTENGSMKCLPTWHDLHTGCLRRDMCDPNPCKHGGSCISSSTNTFSCTCRPDYHGSTCAIRTKPCEAHDHCLHGGKCVNVGLKSTECKCPVGWEGHFCEIDKNECKNAVNPCHNGGSCINTPGGFSCKCTSQFSGLTCERDVDECAEDYSIVPTCHNNGTCINQNGGFKCVCPEGINGTRCEYSSSFRISLLEHARRIHHGRARWMILLSSMLLIFIVCIGLLYWQRRRVANQIHWFIKYGGPKASAGSVHLKLSEDEPRLEFVNEVYEALEEPIVKRDVEHDREDGLSNKAYVNDDEKTITSPKREQSNTQTIDPSYTYSAIPGDTMIKIENSDLKAKGFIDSEDGYVELPDNHQMTPEKKVELLENDEEKLRQLFDDPAKFPPCPTSQDNQQFMASDHSESVA